MYASSDFQNDSSVWIPHLLWGRDEDVQYYSAVYSGHPTGTFDKGRAQQFRFMVASRMLEQATEYLMEMDLHPLLMRYWLSPICVLPSAKIPSELAQCIGLHVGAAFQGRAERIIKEANNFSVSEYASEAEVLLHLTYQRTLGDRREYEENQVLWVHLGERVTQDIYGENAPPATLPDIWTKAAWVRAVVDGNDSDWVEINTGLLAMSSAIRACAISGDPYDPQLTRNARGAEIRRIYRESSAHDTYTDGTCVLLRQGAERVFREAIVVTSGTTSVGGEPVHEYAIWEFDPANFALEGEPRVVKAKDIASDLNVCELDEYSQCFSVCSTGCRMQNLINQAIAYFHGEPSQDFEDGIEEDWEEEYQAHDNIPDFGVWDNSTTVDEEESYAALGSWEEEELPALGGYGEELPVLGGDEEPSLYLVASADEEPADFSGWEIPEVQYLELPSISPQNTWALPPALEDGDES